MTANQERPVFFLSMPHGCSYLPEQTAITLFVDPHYAVNGVLYEQLLKMGFRRSGNFVYRPQCKNCSDCVPARIPVARFSPNRSQKRTWKRNQDVKVVPQKAIFQQEHFEIYHRYQRARHAGGSMDDPNPQKYIDFVSNKHLSTTFYEFRTQNGRLMGVAVTDQMANSLSAVYTFFDPQDHRRSLGTFAVLWQIEQAKRLGLSWLYLGYWIRDCAKMSYKARFQPLELLQHDSWRILQSGQT